MEQQIPIIHMHLTAGHPPRHPLRQRLTQNPKPRSPKLQVAGNHVVLGAIQDAIHDIEFTDSSQALPLLPLQPTPANPLSPRSSLRSAHVAQALRAENHGRLSAACCDGGVARRLSSSRTTDA